MKGLLLCFLLFGIFLLTNGQATESPNAVTTADDRPADFNAILKKLRDQTVEILKKEVEKCIPVVKSAQELSTASLIFGLNFANVVATVVKNVLQNCIGIDFFSCVRVQIVKVADDSQVGLLHLAFQTAVDKFLTQLGVCGKIFV
ncbi:hypothetical protein M8J76_002483 [Diaphorina citri]|nr:hypothetical protein M8J76_002483 [Diaphorina citri]